MTDVIANISKFNFSYDEYVIVSDVKNLVQVPNKLRLDIASLLPSGGLKAYSAVVRAKPFILEKSRTQGNQMVD